MIFIGLRTKEYIDKATYSWRHRLFQQYSRVSLTWNTSTKLIIKNKFNFTTLQKSTIAVSLSSSGKKLSLKEQLRCKLLALLLDFVYWSSSSARCIETFTLTFTLKNYGSTFSSFTYTQTRIMINNNSLTSWWNGDHYKSITDTLKTSDINHQYLITFNRIQTFRILFIIKNSMLSFFFCLTLNWFADFKFTLNLGSYHSLSRSPNACSKLLVFR